MSEKGIIGTKSATGQPLVGISCGTISGTKVANRLGEWLGVLQDIVIDFHRNRVSYAVLRYSGLMQMKDKLFAIPWEALSIPDEQDFVSGKDRKMLLNLPQEALKQSEGFDEKAWPAQPDYDWLKTIYQRYGMKPYWEEK